MLKEFWDWLGPTMSAWCTTPVKCSCGTSDPWVVATYVLLLFNVFELSGGLPSSYTSSTVVVWPPRGVVFASKSNPAVNIETI